MTRRAHWIAAAALGLTACGMIAARDVDPPKEKGKSTKPPTVAVQKGTFRVDVTLKGVFETAAMQEVSVHLEAWNPPLAPLTVVSATEPAASVRKGDVLLKLNTDRIEKAIRDLRAEQQLADLTLKQLDVEVHALGQSTPLDLAAAERAKKTSDEDWKRFNDVEKAFSEESTRQSVKSMRQFLEYAQEELKQLEKMYRNKDMTEETEEIILKRQRNQVESLTFSLKQAEMRRDQFFGFELPRKIERLKDDVARSSLAWDKARIAVPMQLELRKLALEKAKYERARAAERLENLMRDMEQFAVKSPAEGVVYYGRCSQGQFAAAAALLNRLQPGGTIQPDEIVMTIVQPKSLFVRASVDEREVQLVPVGAACKVTPSALPDLKLSGKIERVSAVPIAAGTFEARASVELGDAKVSPGMTCTVKVNSYQKADALSAPLTCVFPDDGDEDKSVVYVWRPDSGKFDRKVVTAGKKSAGRVEILSGVSVGDELAVTKPEAKEITP